MILLPPVSKALLRSSVPPTDEQKTVARRTLEKGARSLRDLESEISRLKNLSSELSLKKQAISTSIKHHRNLLSPFNQLLNDVVEEIFYHCLPIAHNSVMSIDEPPLSLGRICSRWRQIAYSTPRLWTSVHIIIPDPSPTAARSSSELSRLDAISSWLSRSGILPISISIRDIKFPPGPHREDPQPPPEVDIILFHANRLKSLVLDVEENWLLQLLTRLHSDDYPLLRNLRTQYIHYSDPESVITALSQSHSILHAPQLRSLSLPNSLTDNTRLQICWQHLTAFEITYYSPFLFHNFTQMMTSCSGLENLAIDLTCFGSLPDLPSTYSLWSPLSDFVVLPHLRSFTLIAVDGHEVSISQILEVLVTPALTHLTCKFASWRNRGVGSSGIAQGSPAQCFHTFLKRLISPLEELGIRLDGYDETELLDVLRTVPGVKRVSIGGRVSVLAPCWQLYRARPLRDTFLRRFNGLADATADKSEDDQHSDPICPNLEVVYFQDVEFSYQEILQFLQMRIHLHQQNEVSRLRKVKITLTDRQIEWPNGIQDYDIASQLAVWEKDTGLQVHLEYTRLPPPPSPSEPESYDPYAGISAVNLAETLL